ncbi:MAG TPA: hypothetical protein VM901_13090 [Bdellovibrionota bacterium]|jgi:hypothetical protein|nr:hypothetical protein [Bdellovibrionota bacterium]
MTTSTTFRSLTLGVFFAAVAISFAAPPQDLSVFESAKGEDGSTAPVKAKRPARLSESQITAGDTPPPSANSARDANARVVKFDVLCRETGGRQGKAKVKLATGARVVQLGIKQNWSHVTFAPQQPPCWVPATSLAKQR